jgi:hypothetical protein
MKVCLHGQISYAQADQTLVAWIGDRGKGKSLAIISKGYSMASVTAKTPRGHGQRQITCHYKQVLQYGKCYSKMP